uniref:Uncharacterized protein n=1 Tax=Arundo donax TaxID=35708 RepID=A0A0A9CKG3_ARUDO
MVVTHPDPPDYRNSSNHQSSPSATPHHDTKNYSGAKPNINSKFTQSRTFGRHKKKPPFSVAR